MQAKNIAFIGYGKMGRAIAKGLSSYVQNIFAYTPHKENVPQEIYKEYKELVSSSDIIFLAAKPQHICHNIEEALPYLDNSKILISIAAGVSVSDMQKAAQGKSAIVRSMPNLPAAIGKGVFALCFDDEMLTQEQKQEVTKLFELLGAVTLLKEEEIDSFTALAGCGPGFIFHFMESFYQAAVTLGFSHKDARTLTAQTFVGSALLAEAEEGTSFHDLKQQVCSPKGVTIQGVNHLEEKAVKAAIVKSILISAKK